MLLIILAFICMAVGAVGAVVPGLPGPPVAWAGLLVASFSSAVAIGPWALVVAAVAAVLITVADYVVPAMATKKYGGSSYGVWGCNIGLVVSLLGLPFGPQGIVGVLVWPFVGALVGEWLKQRDIGKSFRPAFGSLVGLLTGTLAKLLYAIVLIVYLVVRLIR